MGDLESDLAKEERRNEPRKTNDEIFKNLRNTGPEELQALLDRELPGVLVLQHIANDQDFRSMVEMCNRLLTTKGHDYTQGAEGDRGRLRNFYDGADRVGLKPIQVLAVYLHKHQSAIDTFIQKGQVESEAIDGRIADVINYYLLMWKMIQFERRRSDPYPDRE